MSHERNARQVNVLLAFYKGTAWPAICICQDNQIGFYEEQAHEMITLGLRQGQSLEDQKQTYKEQLDIMEGLLIEYNSTGKPYGTADDNTIARVCNALEQPKEFAREFWYLNVGALLELKVIANDNYNGWHNIKTEKENMDNIVRNYGKYDDK